MSLLDSLKMAKEEDILKGLQEMSPDDRKKIQEAFKLVETETFAAIARSYGCSGSNDDWGEYAMKVLIGKDGSGTVSETTCTFRDSPEETEKWHGTFSISGALITFTGTELETTSSGAGGVHTEPKKPGHKKFCFRMEDKNLLQVSDKTGEEYEMPFGEGKKKILK